MSGRYAKGTDMELQSFSTLCRPPGTNSHRPATSHPTQPVRVILNKPHVRNPTPSPSGSSGPSAGACSLPGPRIGR